MARKPAVAIGLVGLQKDAGDDDDRWARWRPTVALCQHADLPLQRVELLYQPKVRALAERVAADVRAVAPATEARLHEIEFRDPWDFEEVFAALHGFARTYPFDPEREDYLLHISTGTHVFQICLFLLTESRHFPGKLVQSSPPGRLRPDAPGQYRIIDLDLSRYDTLASRFAEERRESLEFLKSGIATRNAAFNQMIGLIEQVALRSAEPILLTGPTGAGKSQLARRIYELKKSRGFVRGAFVDVNCATLRGDAAMSALFGHTRGAYTGAQQARTGLLRKAHEGILFLDEIGELGPDEQAMLLHALEEKRFLPVGADVEVQSDFLLIAGTNRDLPAETRCGRFRDDLLARISLWSFRLPGLRERSEDIAPNLEYELEQFTRQTGQRVAFSREGRDEFLEFARSSAAVWANNFRDLNGAVRRMATLAPGGRISVDVVRDELVRLRQSWSSSAPPDDSQAGLVELLGPTRAAELDRFDAVQLADVVAVCRRSRSLSEAGRTLFAASRARRSRPNDADRLRKYLLRFGLEWKDVAAGAN